ncbi:MAG: DsrE family protein [Pseudomonadota bacterium]
MGKQIAMLGASGMAFALMAAPALADNHASEEEEVVITNEMIFPADAVWKHSFDAYEGQAGEVNAALRRALAFSKAMEEQGVAPERVKIGIVVHGPSVFDVSDHARYGEKYYGLENPNTEVVAELIERGAEIWVCGFAAKYHKVGNVHLLDGVKMAPTGTVAHAELQRRGYGINAY